jgi:LAS superfamily LD-carboxypeptidase LdcB
MVEAAARDGIELRANSCWRSYKHQERLRERWEQTKKGPAPAKPGYSLHHAGVAVDIQRSHGEDEDKDGVNDIDQWLSAHAKEFGFSTIPGEKWHWQRV